MKNKMDENIDALFKKAKEVPPEIPFEKMEKMILNFPNHPIPVTETHWFVKLFNLKYIAMTIIPIIAALSFWFTPNNNPPEIITPIVETKIEKNQETPIILSEAPIVELPEKTISKPTETPVTTLPKTMIQPTEKTISGAPKIDVPKIEQPKLASEKESFVTPKKGIQNFTKPATTVKPDLIKNEPTPLPEISSFRLKKLKRTLYKNLIADKIILNKDVLVEMKLLGDKILVNNHPIPENLLFKYQNITSVVGSGPVRKIKMSRDFVLAGDFTEEGFRGHGVGRFSEKFLETNPEFFQPIDLIEALSSADDILEMESKALHLFANEILDQTPEDTGRKRLFAPNLNGKKIENLHATLISMLENDGFINYSDLFGVIQLPKNVIRINGKNLSGEEFEKYKKLIEEYGIKHGRNRMILISEHHLKVGNYYYGSFSGTALSLPFKE